MTGKPPTPKVINPRDATSDSDQAILGQEGFEPFWSPSRVFRRTNDVTGDGNSPYSGVTTRPLS